MSLTRSPIETTGSILRASLPERIAGVLSMASGKKNYQTLFPATGSNSTPHVDMPPAAGDLARMIIPWAHEATDSVK